MKKLSIIIPLYNEEKLVTKLLDKVLAVKLKLEKEIIVVNDGSKDNSRKVVEKYIKKHPEIILLNKENGGKGSALKKGFERATGDILLIQDADLEYEPKDYPKLIAPILNGKYKVVYGSRIKGKNTYSHLSFYLGGIGVTIATNMLFFKLLTDVYTCYKVHHKDLKPILISAKGNKFDWEPEVTAKILRKGYKIKEVPIKYYPRALEEGKKIKWQDGIDAIKTLITWRFKKF